MSFKAWLYVIVCSTAFLSSCGKKSEDQSSDVKADSFTYDDGTRLQCPAGTVLYQDGYCRAPQNHPNQPGSWKCPAGTVLYTDGLCRQAPPANANGIDARGKYCPPGTILYSDGLCRKPQAQGGISCPYGTVLYSDGVCR